MSSHDNNQNCNLLTLNKNENQSLDIYLPKSEINIQINQLQDLGQLRESRDKSKMIMNVSQTRINNLVIIAA